MSGLYKFVELAHGEIVMLPKEYKIENSGLEQKFDCLQLAGDYIVFGLSTAIGVEVNGEQKTLREIYKQQKEGNQDE